MGRLVLDGCSETNAFLARREQALDVFELMRLHQDDKNSNEEENRTMIPETRLQGTRAIALSRDGETPAQQVCLQICSSRIAIPPRTGVNFLHPSNCVAPHSRTAVLFLVFRISERTAGRVPVAPSIRCNARFQPHVFRLIRLRLSAPEARFSSCLSHSKKGWTGQ